MAYLQRHLPGPGAGDGVLSVDDLVVAAHLGLDGGSSTALGSAEHTEGNGVGE